MNVLYTAKHWLKLGATDAGGGRLALGRGLEKDPGSFG
jgi:hypothetical protein